MADEQIVRQIATSQVGIGSLTLGTPSKGGEVKIYLDFTDVPTATTLLKNAVYLAKLGENYRERTAEELAEMG